MRNMINSVRETRREDHIGIIEFLSGPDSVLPNYYEFRKLRYKIREIGLRFTRYNMNEESKKTD